MLTSLVQTSVRGLLAAWLIVVLPAAGCAQDHTVITDSATGIRLSLPAALLGRQTATRRGTNWTTADKSINVDSLSMPGDLTLRQYFDKLKAIPGRKTELEEWSESAFRLAGRDADGSNFHIEMAERDKRIRGFSLVATPRGAEQARRIVKHVQETIELFPEAVGVGEASPVTAEAMPPGAGAGEGTARTPPLNIQVNLGEIGTEDVKFAPNGNYLAIRDEDRIKLWDVVSGRPFRTLEHTTYFELFTFIKDGALILSFHKDGRARVWDPTSGRMLSEHPIAGIERFDFASKKRLGSIVLREDLPLIDSRLIARGAIIAQTSAAECEGVVELASLSQSGLKYSILDPALECPKKSEDTDEGDFESIRITIDEAHALLYVARPTSRKTKVFDFSAWRPGGEPPTAREMPGIVIALDPAGAHAVLAEGKALAIVRLADGKTVSTLAGQGSGGMFPVASAEGTEIMLIKEDKSLVDFTQWPVAGIAPTFNRLALPEGESARHAVPDSALFLSGSDSGSFSLHAIKGGKPVSTFTVPGLTDLDIARLSPDGKIVVVKGHVDGESATLLVEAGTGKIIRSFGTRESVSNAQPAFDTEFVSSFGFSADNRSLALGWAAGSVEIWNLRPLRLVKALEAAEDQTTSLNYSPDGRFLVGGSRDAGIFVWSLESGKLLRDLERTGVAGHVSTGSVAISRDSSLVAAGPRQRAVSSGDAGRERRVQVWSMGTGKPLYQLSGHEENVNALTFSQNGRWLVSGSNDGTIRYWDPKTGTLGATFAVTNDGRWVIITEKGFFAASSDAGALLSVVKGLEATSVEQLWQSLYAPDLVREFLAGDPSGEVRAATANADLDKVLASGPAPEVTLESEPPAETASDLVDISVRIKDRGKGVGRIEWRVNGATAAVATKPADVGAEFTMSRPLALDQGDNRIEVVAYNASNLLSSVPLTSRVRLEGKADPVKPTLHVLVIGINAYADKGWQPPGDTETRYFPPLSLAASDAKAVAQAFKASGAGLYADVKVTEALDATATLAGLETAIDRMAKEIHPRDTFILFAAAHGTSHEGRFFLLPQDYDGGPNPDALNRRAVTQHHLQDWLANRIKAKRSILLLDTCESGALVSGYSRSRFKGADSESAMGRLHEATGRPVLTAAAEGKPAYEGHEGRGVFTWTLLDALGQGDRDGNGSIELNELVSHVQEKVPQIAEKAQGRGRATARGIRDDQQTARFGSRGENFTLVRRLR